MRFGKFDNDRQAKAVAWWKAHADLQQFGQRQDDAVWDGRTACTHTVWQKIIGFVKGEVHTLNEINALAGMPRLATGSSGPRGMYPDEAKRLVAKANLDYEVLYDQPFSVLLQRARLGPVMYAMRYGSAPEWKGAKYSGKVASAPFAISGGKTQLTGFEDGRHAVVLIARRERLSDTGRVKTVATRSRLRSSPHAGGVVVSTVPKGTTLTYLGSVTGRSWTIGTKTSTRWFKVRKSGSTKTLYLAAGLVGKVWYPVTGHVVYRQEPNHGSGVRPEKPPYDIITAAQAEAEYKAYKTRLGNRLMAFAPKD